MASALPGMHCIGSHSCAGQQSKICTLHCWEIVLHEGSKAYPECSRVPFLGIVPDGFLICCHLNASHASQVECAMFNRRISIFLSDLPYFCPDLVPPGGF